MKHICDQYSGELESSNFTKPLPTIGLYIVAASLACFLFMALDILTSFRDKIYWIKCKLFKLNALNLTLLSIATKLPGDLNTSMPGPQHQLTKVSGIVFLCVSMGFSIPSLGTMDAPDILSNMIALAILVVTVAADIGIQIGTGAIFAFIPEHILLSCVMLLIMLTMTIVSLSTQALKVKASSDELASKRQALSSSQRVLSRTSTDPQARFDSYKSILPKVWTVASTNNVQYVMNREPHSCAAGLLSILTVVILLELEVRYLLLPSDPRTSISSNFCKGDSDYGWSIRLILISQTLVAILASLALSFRLFHGIDFKNPGRYINDAFGFLKLGIVHCMRVQGLCTPSKLEDVDYKATARRSAGNLAGNLAIALVWSLVQVILIISHSICSTVSIVVFCFSFLLNHYFSSTNRNQGGMISSTSIDRGESGSWCSCNIKHVVDAWLQKGSHRPTTHLLQLSTFYNGLVDYTDWSRDPVWLVFEQHVHELHGSCYLFLAVIIHISRSLFMSSNPSAVKNLATAVKEAKKLLLFVDKWVLSKNDSRKIGRIAGKLVWYLMNTRRYGQADAQSMIAYNNEEALNKASEELDVTISIVSLQLIVRDISSFSVFQHQVKHVWEGIRNSIPMDNFLGEPDIALEWLRARTMYIVIYCLSAILDETHVLKFQMEDVREVAHVLGMIQGLKQPLFPTFQVIYSRP
ncbi:uncharacterized protein LOC116266007 [Nymphaea colorata]|uniref:uncharacterized protein LOC116266007 n=1 Tax=Nymphaea colorata TaxID=210225 RepID=UPI00129D3EF7|nr:uncharacterized protein LOC116266007 [Nymphaea colorata]